MIHHTYTIRDLTDGNLVMIPASLINAANDYNGGTLSTEELQEWVSEVFRDYLAANGAISERK